MTHTNFLTLLAIQYIELQLIVGVIVVWEAWKNKWSGFIRVEEPSDNYSHVASQWEAFWKSLHEATPNDVEGWSIFVGYPLVGAIVVSGYIGLVTHIASVVA